MSFLKPAAGALGANAAATGLGHALGADPSRISSIANSIGGIANGLATAGGAAPGYAAPQQPIQNHMQMLDPDTLQAIIRQMGARPQAGGIPQSGGGMPYGGYNQ